MAPGPLLHFGRVNAMQAHLGFNPVTDQVHVSPSWQLRTWQTSPGTAAIADEINNSRMVASIVIGIAYARFGPVPAACSWETLLGCFSGRQAFRKYRVWGVQK